MDYRPVGSTRFVRGVDLSLEGENESITAKATLPENTVGNIFPEEY